MADKPSLRIIAGLDEALRHSRGEIEAKTHRVAYRPDPVEMLRKQLNRSTADRIADALESQFAIGVYVGCYAGCLLTVGLAFVWSWF